MFASPGASVGTVVSALTVRGQDDSREGVFLPALAQAVVGRSDFHSLSFKWGDLGQAIPS